MFRIAIPILFIVLLSNGCLMLKNNEFRNYKKLDFKNSYKKYNIKDGFIKYELTKDSSKYFLVYFDNYGADELIQEYSNNVEIKTYFKTDSIQYFKTDKEKYFGSSSNREFDFTFEKLIFNSTTKLNNGYCRKPSDIRRLKKICNACTGGFEINKEVITNKAIYYKGIPIESDFFKVTKIDTLVPFPIVIKIK